MGGRECTEGVYMDIGDFVLLLLRGGVRARWSEMTLPQVMAAAEFALAADEYIAGVRT
jgi:hypothetical protein